MKPVFVLVDGNLTVLLRVPASVFMLVCFFILYLSSFLKYLPTFLFENHLFGGKKILFCVCQTVPPLAFFLDLTEKMGTNVEFATGCK